MKNISYEFVVDGAVVLVSTDGTPPHVEIFRGSIDDAKAIIDMYAMFGYYHVTSNRMNRQKLKDLFWDWIGSDQDAYSAQIEALLDTLTHVQLQTFVNKRVIPN